MLMKATINYSLLLINIYTTNFFQRNNNKQIITNRRPHPFQQLVDGAEHVLELPLPEQAVQQPLRRLLLRGRARQALLPKPRGERRTQRGEAGRVLCWRFECCAGPSRASTPFCEIPPRFPPSFENLA